MWRLFGWGEIVAGKRPEPRRNGGPAAPKGSRPGRPSPLVVSHASKALRDGALLEQQRRFSEAHKLYSAALNEHPNEITILDAAARAAALADDHRGAINHLRHALTTDPKRHLLRERLAAALLSSGDLAAAEEEAKTLKANESGKASILNLLGVIQKRRGRLSDAIATFREGAAAEPAVHSSWYNLGNTLLGIGEHAEARDA